MKFKDCGIVNVCAAQENTGKNRKKRKYMVRVFGFMGLYRMRGDLGCNELRFHEHELQVSVHVISIGCLSIGVHDHGVLSCSQHAATMVGYLRATFSVYL